MFCYRSRSLMLHLQVCPQEIDAYVSIGSINVLITINLFLRSKFFLCPIRLYICALDALAFCYIGRIWLQYWKLVFCSWSLPSIWRLSSMGLCCRWRRCCCWAECFLSSRSAMMYQLLLGRSNLMDWIPIAVSSALCGMTVLFVLGLSEV